jgi:uncharacterized membrane protein YukC
MAKKLSKQEKIAQEKNRQASVKKKRTRVISYVGIAIAVLLILSMVLSSLRF